MSFGISAVIANVAKIAFLYRPRRKLSAFEITLLSLSLANIICGLCFFFLPLTIMVVSKYFLNPSGVAAGLTLVAINEIFMEFSVSSSLLHIIIITLERLLAVTFPLKRKQLVGKKWPVLCVITVWVVSAVFTGTVWVSSGPMPWRYTLLESPRDFVLPYVVIITGIILILTYGFIIAKIKKARDTLSTDNQKHSDQNAKTKRRNEKALVFNATTVTACFILCTWPSAIKSIWISQASHLNMIFFSLVALKCFLDPIVYFFVQYFRDKRRNSQSVHPKGGS